MLVGVGVPTVSEAPLQVVLPSRLRGVAAFQLAATTATGPAPRHDAGR